MLQRQGFTLIEIVVVLIIIGLVVYFAFPNFTAPNEQALALNAKNNLLAIYSAEQDYFNNNNGVYCTTSRTPSPESACAEAGTPTCAPDLASINCNLGLSIQDNGTYSYACTTATSCTATRTSIAVNNTLILTLNAPAVTTGNGNPTCNLAANLCPY